MAMRGACKRALPHLEAMAERGDAGGERLAENAHVAAPGYEASHQFPDRQLHYAAAVKASAFVKYPFQYVYGQVGVRVQ